MSLALDILTIVALSLGASQPTDDLEVFFNRSLARIGPSYGQPHIRARRGRRLVVALCELAHTWALWC